MTSDATRFLGALLCVLGASVLVVLGTCDLPDKTILLAPVALIAAGYVTASRAAS